MSGEVPADSTDGPAGGTTGGTMGGDTGGAARRAKAPIAVALDAPDLSTAIAWARAVAPHVQFLKIGLEIYLRDGAPGVGAVLAAANAVSPVELFLDLKLHDIPNTVAGAARSVAQLRPAILTVHAAGGRRMVAAACEALPSTRIAGVTVLTSLDDSDLADIGLASESATAVLRLGALAVDAGARALVCSPHEVAAVRAAVGPGITLITPGVRPVGSAVGDQARVTTPAQALGAGADLLVIGRPITGHPDPGGAAAEIAWSLDG